MIAPQHVSPKLEQPRLLRRGEEPVSGTDCGHGWGFACWVPRGDRLALVCPDCAKDLIQPAPPPCVVCGGFYPMPGSPGQFGFPVLVVSSAWCYSGFPSLWCRDCLGPRPLRCMDCSSADLRPEAHACGRPQELRRGAAERLAERIHRHELMRSASPAYSGRHLEPRHFLGDRRWEAGRGGLADLPPARSLWPSEAAALAAAEPFLRQLRDRQAARRAADEGRPVQLELLA